MAYDDAVMRIEKLENGFEVEVYEPAPAPKGKGTPPMGMPEPWKGYAFTSADDAIAFITEKLPTLKTRRDEFSDGFAEATTEEE